MTVTRQTSIASALDLGGIYPRPQMVRANWCSLDGSWNFAFSGPSVAYPDNVSFEQTIEVPYPPESEMSGIGDKGFHDRVWYRRYITVEDLQEAGLAADKRLILHFGAVDWSCRVWVNGHFVGSHRGGQTPFSFDITELLTQNGLTELVVCADDDASDVSVPRGKQDWHLEPHVIWYERTTGIWQTVWIEAVSKQHLTSLRWDCNIPTGSVTATVCLALPPNPKDSVSVELQFEGEVLVKTTQTLSARTATITVPIQAMQNGQDYERFLWTPETPNLISALIEVEDGARNVVDRVSSYLGLRSFAVGNGELLLNDRPIFLTGVLSQNYWPESHLAAPSPDALRTEVELMKNLGFNAARVHQKTEDPRFLFWADRLGLMLWGETAATYAFDHRAITTLTTEWLDIVKRDYSHPSIVAWVPFNESWGVQHIRHSAPQRAFTRGLTNLTRALDPTRAVISNDGWEHTDSDIWTVHDYLATGAEIREAYSKENIREALAGLGAGGRAISMGQIDHGEPIVLSEFGGISLTGTFGGSGWGYWSATDLKGFSMFVLDLLHSAAHAPGLSGFFYTQLTDTGQETNGIAYADRTPKIPVEEVRKAMQRRPQWV